MVTRATASHSDDWFKKKEAVSPNVKTQASQMFAYDR